MPGAAKLVAPGETKFVAPGTEEDSLLYPPSPRKMINSTDPYFVSKIIFFIHLSRLK